MSLFDSINKPKEGKDKPSEPDQSGFLSKLISGDKDKDKDKDTSEGGFFQKLTGGVVRSSGEEGEKHEDLLDKTVDFVQQKMGQGQQVCF